MKLYVHSLVCILSVSPEGCIDLEYTRIDAAMVFAERSLRLTDFYLSDYRVRRLIGASAVIPRRRSPLSMSIEDAELSAERIAVYCVQIYSSATETDSVAIS